MGRKDERAEAIEDAAAQVARNLGDIVESLTLISGRLSSRRFESEREHLRLAIERLDGCQRLLSAEVDSPAPHHGFLRKLVSAGALAGALAAVSTGVVASEIAETYDLRLPIEKVQESAAAADSADRRLTALEAPVQVAEGWEMTRDKGPWRDLLGRDDVQVTAVVTRSQRSETVMTGSGEVETVEVSFGFPREAASVSLVGYVPVDDHLTLLDLADAALLAVATNAEVVDSTKSDAILRARRIAGGLNYVDVVPGP